MLKYVCCGGETQKLEKKEHDAGYDLTASKGYTVQPGKTVVVPTGLKVALPVGHYGQILSRSSLAVNGIVTTGGVIDASYRGEIKIILNNNSAKEFHVVPGQRVAQLVIIKLFEGTVREVQELESTERGEQGFGSTGEFNKKNK